jgi:hypothetical protein
VARPELDGLIVRFLICGTVEAGGLRLPVKHAVNLNSNLWNSELC